MISRFAASVLVLGSGTSLVRADFGTPDGAVEIEVLSDDVGSASATFATLHGDDAPELRIYSTNSPQPLHAIALDARFRFIDIETIRNAGVPVGVAVLGQRRSNGGVRVWQWRLGADRLDGSVSFGTVPEPLDLEVLDTGTADATMLVLGHFPASSRSRVLSRRFESGAVDAALNLGGGFAGQDLEIESAGSGGSPRAHVLGRMIASGASRVRTVSIDSGGLLSSMNFGRIDARDLLLLPGVDETPSRLVVLRGKIGSRYVRIDTRESNGDVSNVIAIRSDAEPIKLIATGQSDSGFAVLTDHALHHRAEVIVVDASDGSVESRSSFGSGAVTRDAVDLRFRDVRGFAIGETPLTEPHPHIKMRTVDGKRVRTVPLARAERMPQWFEAARVQGHTRLPLVHPRFGLGRSFHRADASENAARYFADLGAPAFTRNAKAADEDPWWPSEAPASVGAVSRYSEPRDNEGIAMGEGEDFIQRYIDEGWANGLPINLYYADSGESTLALEYPEWICRSFDGEASTHVSKGFFLDITGDYGRVVQSRILELADKGAGGIYLDFRHMPANGCWGTQLAADYLAATGEVAPARANTPAYRRFVAYFANRVADAIDGWRGALAAEYPHVQMIVSVTSVPALTRSDMSSRLVGIESPKSEFLLAVRRGQNSSVFVNDPSIHEPTEHVRMALGWSLLRDVAGENLAHVWNSSTPNRDHLLAFVSAVTAHGVIAALDVAEELLPPGGQVAGLASREDLRAGFALGAIVSSNLSSKSPVRWAGIHFSESLRDAYGLDAGAAWRELLLPTVAGYDALSRSGLPVKILTDATMLNGGMDDLSVLFVPTSDDLGSSLEAGIADFSNRGGEVLRSVPGSDWSTEAGYESRVARLREAFDDIDSVAPVRVSGLPDGVHAVAFEGDASLTVAVTNRFEFVQSVSATTVSPDMPVNSAPAAVPAGLEVFVSGAALADIDTTAPSFRVYDALTNRTLSHVLETTGLRITLDAFDYLSLVVVR